MADEYYVLWTPERSVSSAAAESVVESIKRQVAEQTDEEPAVERVESFDVGAGSVAGPFLISVAAGLTVEAIRRALLAYSGTDDTRVYVESELDADTGGSVSVEADGADEIEVEIDVTTEPEED